MSLTLELSGAGGVRLERMVRHQLQKVPAPHKPHSAPGSLRSQCISSRRCCSNFCSHCHLGYSRLSRKACNCAQTD